jgi:hypothetical protein
MVAHAPASNLKLGSGIAPVQGLVQHGVQVGIGTDGSVASDNQNLFEAMRLAALVSKVRHPYEPAKWVGASEVFAMATAGGARLLGTDRYQDDESQSEHHDDQDIATRESRTTRHRTRSSIVGAQALGWTARRCSGSFARWYDDSSGSQRWTRSTSCRSSIQQSPQRQSRSRDRIRVEWCEVGDATAARDLFPVGRSPTDSASSSSPTGPGPSV